MTWDADLECSLCGHTSRDVVRQIIRIKDAPPGMTYDWLPRCRDRRACRSRVEASGKAWPVDETRRTA